MLAIPDLAMVDVAFGNINHMPKMTDLPEEYQRQRGPYCRAVSMWFYSGAKTLPDGITVDGVKFVTKPGVDKSKALRAIQAALGSFEPKHEHKIAGCGFMLSEWFTIEQPK